MRGFRRCFPALMGMAWCLGPGGDRPIVVHPPIPAPAASQSADEVAEARLRNNIRLRKLHLVRPDLIPYPLAYEIYC